jgi:hypothetical protein
MVDIVMSHMLVVITHRELTAEMLMAVTAVTQMAVMLASEQAVPHKLVASNVKQKP